MGGDSMGDAVGVAGGDVGVGVDVAVAVGVGVGVSSGPIVTSGGEPLPSSRRYCTEGEVSKIQVSPRTKSTLSPVDVISPNL